MHKHHDQLAKRILVTALEGRGVLTTEQEISPDAQRFDGYFIPGAALAAQGEDDLLYRLAAEPCAFEHFREPPSIEDAVGCLRKLLNARHVFTLAEPPKPLPHLWLLCAGHPRTALEAFGAAPHDTHPPGVYATSPALATGFVVLSQLPVTRETLLLRLMGKGETRRRAVAELAKMPEEARERRLAEPILVRFRVEIEQHPTHDPDDEELLMETADVFEAFQNRLLSQGRDEGRDEGRLEGRFEALKETLIKFYRARFGGMPSQVRAAVEGGSEAELLGWIDLFATKTEDEIQAALRGG